MLTVYDPNVSNRLSIKNCARLRRPQSARVIRASPWDQLVEGKPEGRYSSNIRQLSSHDFTGRGYITKLNATPVTGERGVRTAFAHPYTNQHTSYSLAPTGSQQPQKGMGLYVDARARGVKTPKPPSAETIQKTRAPCIKAVPNVNTRPQIAFGATTLEYQKYLKNQHGKPQSKAHTPYAYTHPTIALSHNPSANVPTYRPVGQMISNDVRNSHVFETKTAMRRPHKVSQENALRSPYGTERWRDPNLPQRRCYHFETTGVLTGK